MQSLALGLARFMALRADPLQEKLLKLLLEVAPGDADEVERIVRDKMGRAVELSVPLEVSVGRGATWRETAHKKITLTLFSL